MAREELRDRLDKAPLDHAEALLAAYEVLQGLNDRGVLDTLKGALGAGETLVETVVEVVKTPEAIRSIRNLLLLSKVLDEIEPELLNAVVRALPDGLAQAGTTTSSECGMALIVAKSIFKCA